jgi:threonine dehydrogenase-like Zn-dependent dehydrogenase
VAKLLSRNVSNKALPLPYNIILTSCIDWEELRDMIENGIVDPTIMVTYRFKIDDVAEAYYM